ncbi:DUF2953 domain-containing protein [Desmospora activa]|uniref:DUF2953 family protein n=1 Tax=Desmospora activa DSM 45169 TaxID=1121389 RepID=A0A2T4Z9R2_9BACL|nr:DUF2953 domain-containing protein [Desmospora activa]PTM58632.1 Protein of unknown function (DUF2953) [Desmospora activa DSM 45169]
MGWLLAAGIAVLFFVVMIVSTVRIRLLYRRQGEDDEMSVHVRMWAGLLRFQYRFPQFRLTSEGVDVKEKTKAPLSGKKPAWFETIGLKTLQRVRQDWRILKYRVIGLYDVFYRFLRHVTCERLIWKSHLGTGDAAETGVITGLAWGVKTSLVGMLGSYIDWLVRPRLDVVPHFQERRLETELDCMIRFRIGHAILAILRLLMRMRGKGGEGTWQNTQFKA